MVSEESSEIYSQLGVVDNSCFSTLTKKNWYGKMDTTWKSTMYQYAFGISAGFSAMAAGAWLSWPSSVIKILKDGSEGINMTTPEIATMVSLMDFGNFLSPIPSSYLMDSIGRKLTLMISGLCCLIASGCVLLLTDNWSIYIARILAGISKGISFAVVPIYLAEISNTNIRGALSTMFIGFLNIGMMYGYLIGPHTSYLPINLSNLAIPIAFLLTIGFFPESPYFLIMKGREGSARKSLKQFKQAESNNMRELDTDLKNIKNKVESDMKNKGRFIDLLTTSSNRRALLIISVLAFFQRSSGISPTIAYSTTIMPLTGGGLPISTYMIIFSILLVISNYLAMPLVDTLGRKPLLIISSYTTAAVTATSGIYYYLAQKTDMSNYHWIPYLCLILFAVTYSIGIGFLPSTLVGELFPTNVKSYAGSISAIILALVSFVVNKVFQAVSETYGVHVMYTYFTLACLASGIFVQFFVFETKGKTLTEIQEYLIQLDRRRPVIV